MRIWRALLRLAAAAMLAGSVLLAAANPAVANHGDIHATCVGDQPVVRERPPGTEEIQVTCVRGLPEFTVMEAPVPVYNPIVSAAPMAIPPDFGGWVTVWMNGHPLKTPYDPVRRIQEPGAYLSVSTGRVMMPVRFFTQAFGGQVEWNEEHRLVTLTLRGQVLRMWADYPYAVAGETPVRLDKAPTLFQDRLFVPVRFLTEGFGAEIQWDHGNRSARVEMPGVACTNRTYCGEVR